MHNLTLTIAFSDLISLTAFVQKMGADLGGATIVHSQPIQEPTPVINFPGGQAAPVAQPVYNGPAAPAPTVVLTAAQKTAATKAAKKAAAEAAAAQAPVVSTPPPFAGNFPGSFAPGSAPVAAPAQPVAQPYVAPVQPQAPVANAPVIQVSPERQSYNKACGDLITTLQSTGQPEAALSQVVAASFQEAGCPQGSRISGISDAQISAFYPILHRNVSQVIASMQQAPATY